MRPPSPNSSNAHKSIFVATVLRRERVGMTPTYAAPLVRDRFLNSLESTDRAVSVELAHALLGCGNPLPGITCTELGLPANSTYDCAARRVLALYSTDAGGRQA